MNPITWLMVVGVTVALVIAPPVLIALVSRAQAERARRQYVRLRPRIGMERKDKER
jgi:hypothetical protein